MKLGLIAAAATFLAIALLTGACGGDGDALTLEEYFEQLQAIDAEIEPQVEALYAQFPEEEDALTDEANLPLLKEIAAGFPRVFGGFMEDVEELEPPSEVEDAHNDLLAAGRQALVVFEEGADSLNSAGTIAEFTGLNDEVDANLVGPLTNMEDACFELQLIAVEHEIDVELTACGEE